MLNLVICFSVVETDGPEEIGVRHVFALSASQGAGPHQGENWLRR